MKQLLLIFISCFLLAGSGKAVTISGTIYTTGGVYGVAPAPAAGATVWIYYNLMGTNYISTTTNSVGAYSITIPASWPYSATPPLTLLDLRDTITGGCSGQKQMYYYGTNIICNDTLCNYKWYTLAGNVTLQGGGAAANAKVWLISEQQDTSVTPVATVLGALDSTVTNASGAYLFARTGYYIYAKQMVKAALQPANPNYSNYLPTYHDSSLLWSGATTFGASAWTSSASNLNISLRGGTNPGGPGFIGGDILLGANKSTAVGDPLPGRVLLLTTSAGKGIAYTYSNSSGHFNFANLPLGTYKLFGDAWGKTNPALTFTLTASNPGMTNIIFDENSTTFKGRLTNLGVTNAPGALSSVSVYPNPVTDNIRLSGLNDISGSKTVVLSDITGSILLRQEFGSGQPASISAVALPAGMYLLRLYTEAGNASFKIVK